MSWSREEALTDPAVREPMMFTSEFRFRLVVDEMVSLYNTARAQGLTPDISWLKPNENFPNL